MQELVLKFYDDAGFEKAIDLLGKSDGPTIPLYISVLLRVPWLNEL